MDLLMLDKESGNSSTPFKYCLGEKQKEFDRICLMRPKDHTCKY